VRVDVDFNERDRQGHVVARVPGDLAARLAPGRHVYLYDPVEQLWAEGSVAQVNQDTRIAAFDVDWHSFADAEVADVRQGEEEWLLTVPLTEKRWLLSGTAENLSTAQGVVYRIRVETAWPPSSGTLVVVSGTSAGRGHSEGTSAPSTPPASRP
jgi:hypothetical protein